MVSVVIPCYNPPSGWADVLYDAIRQCAADIDDEIELILVVDGVTENVTEDHLIRLTNLPVPFSCIKYDINKGKGYAIRKGVEKAKGRIIIYTDIDFPYTIQSFGKIHAALSDNACDIAVGVKDDYYYSKVPFFRKFVSRSLRAMIRLVVAMPVSDTQCGLKGFQISAKEIFLATTTDRYLFDLEFIRIAYRHSAKPRILEIPIRLKEGVTFRSMNPRILISELVNFMKIIIK